MKNEIVPRTNHKIPSQVLVGVLVIGVGLLFLLDNLDILDSGAMRRYWPVLLVLFGAVKLIDADTPHERFTFGLVTGVGVILTLGKLNIPFFQLRLLWPLILIVVGGLVVYKALAGRRQIGSVAKDGERDDSVLDVTAIMGGFERRITTPDFRGGEVTAVMGGCQFDLRGSSIQGEAVLNVFAVMGGISLKVPPDWTIVLQGSPIMGAFDEKTITPPHGEKRLVIKGYAIMGGVEVRN